MHGPPDLIKFNPLRRGKNGGQARKGYCRSLILNWLRHPLPHSPLVLLEEPEQAGLVLVGALEPSGGRVAARCPVGWALSSGAAADFGGESGGFLYGLKASDHRAADQSHGLCFVCESD